MSDLLVGRHVGIVLPCFDAVVVVLCWHIMLKEPVKGTSLPVQRTWLIVERERESWLRDTSVDPRSSKRVDRTG